MKRIDSFKGKGVLVTGAGGFIGSYLCRRLSDLGARIHWLDLPGVRGRPVRGRPRPPERSEIIEADIADLPSLDSALSERSLSFVFHLAALTDVRRYPALEDPCGKVNHQGTLNLAQVLMNKQGISRLVHFGTCEEYGDGKAPFREEDAPKPVSPYSASKAKASLHMRELGRSGDLPVVVIRPFLTYGPGQPPGRFIAQAVTLALRNKPLRMTPGEQTREFTQVNDLVDGVLAAAVVPDIEGEIINLASGVERKLKDTASMIYCLAGASAKTETGALPYREGEAMRFYGSTEKCRRLLGYNPPTSLEDGLRHLIDHERDSIKGDNNA